MRFTEFLEYHATDTKVMAIFKRGLRTRDEAKVYRYLAVCGVDISSREKMLPYLLAGYVFTVFGNRGQESVGSALSLLDYIKGTNNKERPSALEKRLIRAIGKPLIQAEKDIKTLLNLLKDSSLSYEKTLKDLLFWETDFKGNQGKKWLQDFHSYRKAES
jgi:hypothetical protein